MRFHASLQLSNNIAKTPEGFLICKDVAIARTGTQLYHNSEVPVTAGSDGTVQILRTPEEVFHPDAVASFEGKPITLHHPEDAVTPENWRDLANGHVQNVRPGKGLESDALYADFLIMDAAAIKKVLDREIREVSCGYDADYVEDGPGKGRQTNIRGNHVALVEMGRCGSMCAIHDHKTKDSKDADKASEQAMAQEKMRMANPTDSTASILWDYHMKAANLHKADGNMTKYEFHRNRADKVRGKRKEELRQMVILDAASCEICGSMCAIHDANPAELPKGTKVELNGQYGKTVTVPMSGKVQVEWDNGSGSSLVFVQNLTVKDAASCEICGSSPASKYDPAQAVLCAECKAAFEGQKKNTGDDEDEFTKDQKGGKDMKVPWFKKVWDSLTADEKKEIGLVQDAAPTLTADQRLDKIEKSVGLLVKMFKDAAAFEGKETEDEDEDEEKKKKKETEDEEKEETKDCNYGNAKDAAPVHQEIFYRASILAPDLKPFTLDSVRSKKAFKDACCLHKRKALDAAARSEDGKAIVAAFAPGVEDFFTADCKTVDMAFVGASEVMKRNGGNVRAKFQMRDAKSMNGGVSVADLNKKNQAFWDARKGGK